MKKLFILLLSCILFCSCNPVEWDTFSTVCGVVVDLESQSPIGGVSVYLSPGGNSNMTGSDGYFKFTGLEAQQYTLTVQKKGYKTNRRTITAIAGETHEISITLAKQ